MTHIQLSTMHVGPFDSFDSLHGRARLGCICTALNPPPKEMRLLQTKSINKRVKKKVYSKTEERGGKSPKLLDARQPPGRSTSIRRQNYEDGIDNDGTTGREEATRSGYAMQEWPTDRARLFYLFLCRFDDRHDDDDQDDHDSRANNDAHLHVLPPHILSHTVGTASEPLC